MDSTKSSASGSTRTERGILLWITRRDEIKRVKAHVYRVPSCTSDEEYIVWTDLKACNCPDHPRAKAQGLRCKHVVAASLTMHHRRELREIAKKEIAKS